MSFTPVIPILRSFDEAKAREFYVDLSEHHGDGTPGSHVRIQVDDLEACFAVLQARPYKYDRPSLQDQDWGMRELVVKDGAGNALIFWRPL